MKKVLTMIAAGLCVLLLRTETPTAQAAWGDLFQGVRNLIGGSALQNEDIVAALKEALRVGADRSVTRVGRAGGYLNNPDIRIPLPGALAKTEKLLRLAGYGGQVDAFAASMNRAAEQAAPAAREIFWQAVGEMTLEDARQILNGGDTAATDYFAERTRPRLAELFRPVVHDSMAAVGTTRRFQDLNRTVSSLPFGETVSFDLDRYVTEQALDGLFLVLGQEEARIRQDPAARTTELLKKVFAAPR